MNNENNSMKMVIAKLPSWVKYGILVIIILSVNIAYIEMRIELEKEQSDVRLYFLESRVKISYANSSPVFIDLIRTDEIANYNELTEGSKIEFQLINSQLGLEANFSKVEIYFYMEKQLWMKYDLIQANFFIEDNSGVIRKYDFYKSTDGLPIYIGLADVSNLMWKDAVPQEIRANVIFSNI
jgi:hypothetical protein